MFKWKVSKRTLKKRNPVKVQKFDYDFIIKDINWKDVRVVLWDELVNQLMIYCSWDKQVEWSIWAWNYMLRQIQEKVKWTEREEKFNF